MVKTTLPRYGIDTRGVKIGTIIGRRPGMVVLVMRGVVCLVEERRGGGAPGRCVFDEQRRAGVERDLDMAVLKINAIVDASIRRRVQGCTCLDFARQGRDRRADARKRRKEQPMRAV